MDHCPASNLVSELTHLAATYRHSVDHHHSISPNNMDLYNQDTCIKFHKLLVATLLAYGKALETLCAAYKGGFLASMVTSAWRVWYYITILWGITYSGVLHHHLEVLEQCYFLIIPRYKHIGLYQGFTTFAHPDYQMALSADDLKEADYAPMRETYESYIIKLHYI